MADNTATMGAPELPPLPLAYAPFATGLPGYTADQMQAYARTHEANVRAALAGGQDASPDVAKMVEAGNVVSMIGPWEAVFYGYRKFHVQRRNPSEPFSKEYLYGHRGGIKLFRSEETAQKAADRLNAADAIDALGAAATQAKLAMIDHPFTLTWGEELAKAIEDNHVISGGNGPNWIAGWETANSCAAGIVRLRVSQLAATQARAAASEPAPSEFDPSLGKASEAKGEPQTSLIAPAAAPLQVAQQAHPDTVRLDWLEDHPTLVKYAPGFGAWLTPGLFEESTLRQAIDIVREDLARAAMSIPAPKSDASSGRVDQLGGLST